MPRSIGSNMPMEYTTWHNIIRKTPNNQSGVNIQVTGFYQESTNETNLGKYFGVDKKNLFKIASETDDIFYGYIFHDQDGDNTDTSASIKFEPNQTAYGARFDYFQDLEFLLKGLYLKASTSLIRVENDMHMQIINPTDLFADQNLKRYFAGKYVNLTNSNKQTYLTHAKIDGKQSSSGFTDVELAIGYKLFDRKRYQIKLDLGVTIPAGNTVKGKYLFEPVRGNGGHWGFGGRIDFQVDIWQKKDWSIKLIHAYNYRYLFKGTETRTLSLNKITDFVGGRTIINFSQYYLLGKQGALAESDLIPAANILTTALDVTPGSQLEGVLEGLRLRLHKFVEDVENKINATSS